MTHLNHNNNINNNHPTDLLLPFLLSTTNNAATTTIAILATSAFVSGSPSATTATTATPTATIMTTPPRRRYSQQSFLWTNQQQQQQQQCLIGNNGLSSSSSRTSNCTSKCGSGINESKRNACMFARPSFPSSSSSMNNQMGAFFTTLLKTVGPTAILMGGTAVLYRSLLLHPQSTLTPVAAIYMLLLAIQTSMQPKLSKTFIPNKMPKVRVALTEEIIKTIVASILLVCTTKTTTSTTTSTTTTAQTVLRLGREYTNTMFHDWTVSSSLVVAGIPAVLYAVQGVLTYQAQSQLQSSVIFNGLSQTKTLWAALCCYVLLHQKQSPYQIVALGLLLFAAILFQQSPSSSSSGGGAAAAANTTTTNLQLDKNGATPTDDNNNNNNKMSNSNKRQQNVPWNLSRFMTGSGNGAVPCLMATFLSGLAGALSQKGLQMVSTNNTNGGGGGGGGRNAFLYTVEVSFFSAVTLLVTQLMTTKTTKTKSTRNTVRTTNHTVDDHDRDRDMDDDEDDNNETWTWHTYIPITTKAMGGILTALVHKHAGSVVKGFALMLGLVISGILQSLWFGTTTTTTTTTATRSTTATAACATTSPPPPTTTTTRQPPQQQQQRQQERQRGMLPLNQVAGIIMVMFSSWLHFTNPPSIPSV